MTDLTHTDDLGKARMVDVSGKELTDRRAIASGTIVMSLTTLDAIRRNAVKKGDVLSVARVAAIL
ncbi:MAG: cyclic pyranopterin monophosphate synthase MoaC, partial [Gemmatimonadaceae bacterium]